MTTRQLTVVLIALLAIFGALYVFTSHSAPDAAVGSPINDPEARAAVEEFGAAMKQVPLLATAADVKIAMDQSYGPYVAPELLAQWEANPEGALGRTVSSPWPERINVATVDVRGDRATIEGTVIEVASVSGGQDITGTYPVTFQLEKRDGKWLITSVQKGPYSQLPTRTTIIGTYECLPHRDTSGPQTAECAFGIKEDGTGKHYAIDTRLMASTSWQGMPTGAHIRIEGVLTPIETISSKLGQKYDIVGIIGATTITRQ